MQYRSNTVLTVALLWFFLPACNKSQPPTAAPARLVSVTKPVTVNGSPAKVGARLAEGDVVIIEKDAVIPDGMRIPE